MQPDSTCLSLNLLPHASVFQTCPAGHETLRARSSRCSVTAAMFAGPCAEHAMAYGPVEPSVLHACHVSAPILLHVCSSKKLCPTCGGICSQDGIRKGSASSCKREGSTTRILTTKSSCPQAGAHCTSMQGRRDMRNCEGEVAFE